MAEGSQDNQASPSPAIARIRPVATWLGLAKKSYKDWLSVLVLLSLLVVTEEAAGGRQMYITPFMLDQIQFPFGDSTVPSWSVPVYTLTVPPVVMGAHAAWTNKPAALSHYAILGATYSTSVSAFFTNILKMTVGRPRPNFFYRCFPNGEAVWSETSVNGQRVPECSPKDKHDVVDGYKSFPSGHTSWSMGSMGFLSLYIVHFWRPGGIETLFEVLLALIPVCFASWVGATRVIDYYHNASDVVAGGLLGAAVAALAFYIIFPWGKLPKVSSSPDSGRAQDNVEMLPV